MINKIWAQAGMKALAATLKTGDVRRTKMR